MMKRKSKTPTGVKASKIIRTEESRGSLEEDEEEDFGQSSRDSHVQTTSSAGDIGVIESISLKNFMCHHLLGPFQFGPNVNFIVGNNGSGKSAILTALIVGLGGKATVTNRGASLKGFVRNGESSADVIIRLRNRGSDAYKGEIYGDCISIEQHITSDGSRTCKLKSKTGHLVSNKREELTSILDHFNIQVDNPVSILNQEMSKQFLQSKNEADKYKFFMKATLLEQMKRDYIHIKQTKAGTTEKVEKQEEVLKSLRQEYLQKKEKYENLSSLEEMKKTLEDLQHKMAWCLVSEKEHQVQQLNEQIEQEESKDNYEEKLSRCQVKKDQEVAVCCAENNLKQLEEDRSRLQERIQNLRNSGLKNYESELLKRQREISAMKKEVEKREAEGSALNQQIQDQQKALFSVREESDKLRLEEKNIQVVIEAKQKRRNQLMASRSNRIKRFGDRMPDLLESIDKAHSQGRFLKKPIGPIGACVTLKDPGLAVAVESCLRSFMKTFCCDNYRDEKVLQGLMSQYFPAGGRPQIIVCPFSDRVYDVRGRGVYHPEFPSVLDCLAIPSPVVANCLIDMRGIETVLVIKDNKTARRVMQRDRPPKNCREAFTADGDQVYTNRYYSAESSRSLYLGGDLEADIRMVESELENARAQLARFQLHSSSVMRDIQQKENDLQGLVLRLKKNQAAVNQLKVQIVDLENTEDTRKDDISTLEEEAREVEEKMESEERSVREARAELDETARQAEDLERRYRDVQKQLKGEEGTVKKELDEAETESNRLTVDLKHLERLQQEHQENIQAMRNELAFKEAEAQEYAAKAQRICPERQQVNRSGKSIDTEITRLRHRISAQESSQGTQEQITREYKEAVENYRSKTSQVRDLRKFVSRLDYIINDRQARYKILRRSLSVRCKLYFNYFLTELNCCGSMMFDHNNETLSISVKPPGSEDADVSDVRSLSGGERSFSTVCFILSLWEITESPFRCLDEFDVYMDMHNRRVSMDLLLSLSERQQQRQFLFITPQSTSTLPKSNRVRILTLADPERGPSQDQDSEEEE
ncbi:structural maintenance of chromosomes protein 6 [Megalops cyprinoides]|uniref:structural maintenance of chromosomes protein 6 n=1 Tax=Megalops cyprinoides TaxID=118141 RepID=UPI00186428AE|nr:structural maintenance of chromosomes protein 6 [Megalops cyprinoides]